VEGPRVLYRRYGREAQGASPHWRTCASATIAAHMCLHHLTHVTALRVAGQGAAACRAQYLTPEPWRLTVTYVASATQCALVIMRRSWMTKPVPVDSRLGWFCVVVGHGLMVLACVR
jgi:hypothetical protein